MEDTVRKGVNTPVPGTVCQHQVRRLQHDNLIWQMTSRLQCFCLCTHTLTWICLPKRQYSCFLELLTELVANILQSLMLHTILSCVLRGETAGL